MSCLTTKPTKWLCAQRRLRSAWASTQSDQSSLSAWRKLGSLATDAQADLSLRWVHSHFVGFVTRQLILEVSSYQKSASFTNQLSWPPLFKFGFGFYSMPRLFYSFWAKSIVRWHKNMRSPRKNTWPPASRTWLVRMWPELGSIPQWWDEMTSDLERWRLASLTTRQQGPPFLSLLTALIQCINLLEGKGRVEFFSVQSLSLFTLQCHTIF